MLALGEDVGDFDEGYHFQALVFGTPLNNDFSVFELGVDYVGEALQLLGLVVVAAANAGALGRVVVAALTAVLAAHVELIL